MTDMSPLEFLTLLNMAARPYMERRDAAALAALRDRAEQARTQEAESAHREELQAYMDELDRYIKELELWNKGELGRPPKPPAV